MRSKLTEVEVGEHGGRLSGGGEEVRDVLLSGGVVVDFLCLSSPSL
jgi:hypothetical protein